MLDLFSDAWDAFWSIPHVGLYLVLFWLAYLLVLGLWIVLQKREPVATLSWLVSLAALPYVGFLIYHVLGPQRIQRQTLRRGRARINLADTALPPPNAPQLRELGRLGKAVGGFAPSSAAEVRFLVDGAAKYKALLADLANARKHVHMEYYIYTPDQSGEAVRDALIDCVRRGVKVRLLLDAIGSAKAPRRWFAEFVDAGGELAWFHPMRFGQVWMRPWLNLRTHRKIVVIDGRIAYTGGMNITDDQDESVNPMAYRDLHLRMTGPVVRQLQLVFAEDWVYATEERGSLEEIAAQTPAAECGRISAQTVVSGPDSPWEAIHRVHVGAIHAATRRVWLVTPYFVPGEAAKMALTSAAFAGLDVRLLVPKMSDSKLVTYAARSYYGDLLEAGVKIHEYGPRMLHTKALLVDDGLAIIGSANFDHRSFRLNFEVSVQFLDQGIAADLARHIEGELASAPALQRQQQRPLRERLPEAVARLLSPIL
ncbi:MAG: cardiolipin synthase [Pseudoxanthomonas suwonensis]|nr:cardiolipin synthase [Pseudoxanthomonas suwonensis]